MRIAAVDVGTNTVLLLVVEREASGRLAVVAERATITRLGEGVDRNHTLAPDAVERTRRCLADYAQLVGQLAAERVAVVGTSAMRDARGGDELRAEIRAMFGVEPRVLNGEEEARLTFRGALSGLPIDESRDIGVFDIGGGSTEVVLGRVEHGQAHLSFSASFDIGSVRLTERHGEDRAALVSVARTAFRAVPPLPEGRAPVGVAGTMTTLAAVSLGLEPYDGAQVHGHVLGRDELAHVLDRLAAADLPSRRRVRGMEPQRADVIIAGGCLALALMDHWSATSVVVSDRGVRWGVAGELAG